MLTFFLAGTLLPFMQLFASLLRASRALLGEEQGVVGGWVDLDRREVGRWEAARYKLLSKTAVDLRKALEKHGVDFLDPSDGVGAGVRLRAPREDDPHRSAQYRAARALLNVSQATIAERAGVNRNFVARLELGSISGLNLETVRALDAAYVDLNVLMIPETLTTGVGVRWRSAELES